MYRHCLFCQADLGTNEVIEPLPIGRRVAFDAARGRLWVVCQRCERWNLTPFDSRLDAIDECERRFRATKLRVSTDNVGLARLTEGLELVRIGEPLRPEMAAWRYGDQFGRRRKRHILVAGAAVGGVAAIWAGALWISGVGALGWFGDGVYSSIVDRFGRTKIPAADGRLIQLVPSRAQKARFRFDPDARRLEMTVKSGGKVERWIDDDARAAASLVLPRANISGAAKDDVRRAVALVADTVTTGDPLLDLIGRGRLLSGKGVALHKIGKLHRLALEMALHEEQERRALEGELKILELRWQEAEQIAAIADSLTVPDSVNKRLAGLKESAK